jgi:hypothetical protein
MKSYRASIINVRTPNSNFHFILDVSNYSERHSNLVGKKIMRFLKNFINCFRNKEEILHGLDIFVLSKELLKKKREKHKS